MLKNYFFLGLLFIFLSGINAQKTYIPDDNFEQTLIDYGIDSDGIVNDSVATADISGITQLYIDNKSISDLTGIEDFISLVWFGCDNNQLISLDVSQNTSLFSLSCYNNQLTSLNINGLTDLTALYVDNNQLTHLSLNQNLNLQSISCSNNQLTQLSVSANIYLTDLFCDNNQITSMDVSDNIILNSLVCYNNQITFIYLGNIDLMGINCSDNQLTSLDVSQNIELKNINCSNNQLTSLNVKNGNNTIISYFNATNNPSLLCIQIDNETDANNGASPYNNWQKDATATYSEDCSTYGGLTYVPDDNFEQALIDLGYDDVLDDYVVTSNISEIDQLYVYSKNINDLTGIEDFISLLWLACDDNQLINIDVSQNTSLFGLSCENNQLTSLNINGITDLTDLYIDNNQLTYISLNQNLNLESISCSNNQLISLDVSQNTSLFSLSCENNQLTTIDVSQNRILQSLDCNNNQIISIDFGDIELEGLNCSENQLTSLNLSQNTWLYSLYCDNNQIATLDLSQNIWLHDINCSENQLTSLNVKNGNNSIISNFNATNNPSLLCIQVDNETDANNGVAPYDTWVKDATATYSEDCESYLGVDDEILSEGLILYPNPISDILTVDSKIPIKKVEIFNILGQKEIEINSGFNYILLNNLTRGFYIIKIYSEKGSIVRKLIKK